MKKRIMLLLIALALLPLGMTAQDHALWKDAIHVGADYGFNLSAKNGKEKATLNAVALRAGYQKFFYMGMFVMPELTLFYQRYKIDGGYDCPVGFPSNTPTECRHLFYHPTRYGLGLDAMLGVRIIAAKPLGVDLMTGPSIETVFASKLEESYNSLIPDEKFEFRWRFGLGFSILGKATIRATYDISSNDKFDSRGDVMTVGVAYTF